MAKLQVKWFIAEDQKFNTGHVQVKLSTRPASRDVKWEAGYYGVNFRTALWTGDTNLENAVIWWYLKPRARCDHSSRRVRPEACLHEELRKKTRIQQTKLSLRRSEQGGHPRDCCEGQMKTFYQKKKNGQLCQILLKTENCTMGFCCVEVIW